MINIFDLTGGNQGIGLAISRVLHRPVPRLSSPTAGQQREQKQPYLW